MAVKESEVVLVSPMGVMYYSHLPYALLFLSSYLETNGIRTQIVDLRPKIKSYHLRVFSERISLMVNRRYPYFDAILSELKQRTPLLIGLQCYTAHYPSVMQLAKFIKEENSNIAIVAGGVHATIRPQDFIFAGSPIDFAISGEGETPLLKLARALKDKSGFDNIEGLSWLKDGKTPIIGSRNIEADISQFPVPDYGKVDMKFYTYPCVGNIEGLPLSGVGIITSRGCPYNCHFCANIYMRPENNKISRIRYRPAGQIADELQLLKDKYKIDGFFVTEACPFVTKERVVDFCETLIKRNLNLVWGTKLRADFLDDEGLLRLMKRTGLMHIDFGVESGSPAMLKAINKQITVGQIKNAFRLCRKNGIRTSANIMFNLPNEIEEDLLLTQELLDRIKPTVAAVQLYVPELGSKFYEEYVSPQLTTSEYDIYGNDANFHYEINDKRFKFVKHNTDLEKLMARLRMKHNKLMHITFRPAYWKRVIVSPKLSEYMLEYIILFFYSFYKVIVECDSFFFKNYLKKTFKKVISLFVPSKKVPPQQF